MTRVLAPLVAFVASLSVASSQPLATLELLQLRPTFYMIAGAGGNIAVQVGEDGAVLVDAGGATASQAVVATVKSISPRPIRYIINTGADEDHVGGNEAVAKAGQTLFSPRSMALPQSFLGGGASILAAEQVLTRMSAAGGESRPAAPVDARPTETFYYERKYMYLNGEGIEVLRQPAAHSDADSLVFFRRSDVVVTGDIIDIDRFPVIDVARGGSIQGVVDALNNIVKLAIPSVPIVSREAGTLVIPGHGRVLDQLDVVAYRDMVTIVRDRVSELRASGAQLAQVQAARPARGYTRQFGEASAIAFIEAVYRTLPSGRAK